MTNETEIPDARDPEVNPLVEIVLRFREGNGMVYRLDKPISQFEAFKALGEMAAALGFHPTLEEILVGDEDERLKRLDQAVRHMKRTSIGPERSNPPDTAIYFMFEDEWKAVLADERSTV